MTLKTTLAERLDRPICDQCSARIPLAMTPNRGLPTHGDVCASCHRVYEVKETERVDVINKVFVPRKPTGSWRAPTAMEAMKIAGNPGIKKVGSGGCRCKAPPHLCKCRKRSY